jgi:hypothetical protein
VRRGERPQFGIDPFALLLTFRHRRLDVLQPGAQGDDRCVDATQERAARGSRRGRRGVRARERERVRERRRGRPDECLDRVSLGREVLG